MTERLLTLLTYLLAPCSIVLLEKLRGSQLLKKFPTFYGTRRFITAVTSAFHMSMSWARSIQSTPPHPTSWRSILILSSHLHLGLPSGCTWVSSRSEAYYLTVSEHDTFSQWGVVSTSPNPQTGGPPLVGCLWMLIQYTHSYPPYWRPFLHLQPEDTPCYGDRDPLIMG